MQTKFNQYEMLGVGVLVECAALKKPFLATATGIPILLKIMEVLFIQLLTHQKRKGRKEYLVFLAAPSVVVTKLIPQ